jgi:hypothetical protein
MAQTMYAYINKQITKNQQLFFDAYGLKEQVTKGQVGNLGKSLRDRWILFLPHDICDRR